MPARFRAPTSQRQIDLVIALWSSALTAKEIAAEIQAGRRPGEPMFNKNHVCALARELGLPSRVKPKGQGPLWTTPQDAFVPPLGRLPDEEEVHRAFAGQRFTDAKVPEPRGRFIGFSATPYRSSMTLFEGMAE